MSRSFLTGLNLNKNELLNARIQNLANPPSNPVTGQIYYDTDTDQINVWDGVAWAALAAGGNVGDQIQSAIDALTTDDIEEGSTNLYYTDTRAKDDAAALLTGATLENITITGDGDGLTITAENGVADSTTDDLTEGTTNLYFTDQRALDATATAYDPAGSAASAQSAAESYADGLATNYDPAGSAASAQAAAESYADGLASNYDAAGSAASAQAAAESYADALVQGLNVKDSVRIATTENIESVLYSLIVAVTLDGVSLELGDRVLVKNQSTATENGIYVVGNDEASRAPDADPVADELGKGSYVLVTEGTYAATGWLVSAYSAGATTWTQFSAANEYTAGTNIAIAGNAISFNGILPVANGGTNANTAAGAKTELGFTTKYSENNTLLEPTSNVVTWTVTHNMNSRDVAIQVYENSGYAQVEVDVVRTNANTATLTWVATANVAADTYRAVVIG